MTISVGNHQSQRYHPRISNTIERRNRWYYFRYETVTRSIAIEIDFYFRCFPTETYTILCWRKSRYIKPYRNRRLYHSKMPIVLGHHSCSNSVSTHRSKDISSNDQILKRRDPWLMVWLLDRQLVSWLLQLHFFSNMVPVISPMAIEWISSSINSYDELCFKCDSHIWLLWFVRWWRLQRVSLLIGIRIFFSK